MHGCGTFCLLLQLRLPETRTSSKSSQSASCLSHNKLGFTFLGTSRVRVIFWLVFFSRFFSFTYPGPKKNCACFLGFPEARKNSLGLLENILIICKYLSTGKTKFSMIPWTQNSLYYGNSHDFCSEMSSLEGRF